MYSRRVKLIYRPDKVGEPIIYNLIKRFDVEINIIHARISPDEEGKLVMDIKAEEINDLEKGINYLLMEGIEVKTLDKSIVYNEEDCVFCGACTGLCKTGALKMDEDSWELVVDHGKCLLCGMCIDACSLNALSLGVNGKR
ncbi:MAG: 4Fe-4S binding protein [Halanaerobiaceae bacterium]|jgi:ferredoxin|nr:4Fe-4S binding protein [Halanaerobiaceae bacterium]